MHRPVQTIHRRQTPTQLLKCIAVCRNSCNSGCCHLYGQRREVPLLGESAGLVDVRCECEEPLLPLCASVVQTSIPASHGARKHLSRFSTKDSPLLHVLFTVDGGSGIKTFPLSCLHVSCHRGKGLTWPPPFRRREWRTYSSVRHCAASGWACTVSPPYLSLASGHRVCPMYSPYNRGGTSC